MLIDPILPKLVLPEDMRKAVAASRSRIYPDSREELLELCCGPERAQRFFVRYPVPGKGEITEAEVVRCKNGIAVNYPEEGMRRRDPDSMLIGDELPSDKPRFSERYGYSFSCLREETMRWVRKQSLILLPFMAGGERWGKPALLICPANAAFFALTLADLQGFLAADRIPSAFRPEAILLAAPPFRHSHFAGKQRVVHVRSETCHEIFAYNLYPGPSAKKGVFSFLLDSGEKEGFLTNHASCVRAESREGRQRVFLHEGASGGGKSEMLEALPKTDRGDVLLAENTVTGERIRVAAVPEIRLRPAADDMVLSKRDFTDGSGRLGICDAEAGWFLRVDGDTGYGENPSLEKCCVRPSRPLLFFNLQASPGAVCLPWEPIPEENGGKCSNPRVVMPRDLAEDVCKTAVMNVDIRSFGVRMPPSTRDTPDIGVMGMVQVVPAALAWLWRLVSPRGYRNPSISGGTEGLKAEGVGSYWPFATGTRAAQANLLLRQMMQTPGTINLLLPNQYVGAWKVDFLGQKLVRNVLCAGLEELSGDNLSPARCPLFGWSLNRLHQIPEKLLRPEKQPELGPEGYDRGAGILSAFFKRELETYLCPELDPLGAEIIELCLRDAGLEEYLRLSTPEE